MTRAWLLSFGLLLAGCGADGEARGFAELGIEVENQIGARSQVSCEALPFLHGSRRLTEHVVDSAFSITVFSSPDAARLTFTEGARSLREDLVIQRVALEGEYSEELSLQLGSGAIYFVDIAGGCAP